MTPLPLLARSAYPGRGPQLYADHIVGVRSRALQYLNQMRGLISKEDYQRLEARLIQVADMHDLGKLLEENQQVLRDGPGKSLAVPHENAGSWLFYQNEDIYSAALVYGHHRPGLPNMVEQTEDVSPLPYCRESRQIRSLGYCILNKDILNEQMKYCLGKHKEALPSSEFDMCQQDSPSRSCDTLEVRILLSLLVNSDWDDAAGKQPPSSTSPRWTERLVVLKDYERTRGLSCEAGERKKDERNSLRSRLFETCLEAAAGDGGNQKDSDKPRSCCGKLLSCEAPVGMGKTLAFLAYALKRAERKNLRHLFIILPYTSILKQVENVLEQSILLNGEDAQKVIGVIHHRAEYDNDNVRDIAANWDTPIILTTAVQFFETLASNAPARLKKLHHLPGSALVFDEFDAALPPNCIPLAWKWLSDLASRWGCDCVFSSGTLVSFWDDKKFKDIYAGKAGHKIAKPVSLLNQSLTAAMVRHNKERVKIRQCDESFSDIADLVRFVNAQPGPRIVMMDTRESAARVAAQLRDEGSSVLHLSNALAPRDCDITLKEVEKRLEHVRTHGGSKAVSDWTLVSTTYAGVGLDLSFRTGLIRAFSCSSVLQLTGRVSRNSEYPDASLWIFDLNDAHAPLNPGMKNSSEVLHEMLTEGVGGSTFVDCPPADLATCAFKQEFKLSLGSLEKRKHKGLLNRERVRAFKDVAERFKVIDDEAAFIAIVDDDLAKRVREGGGYSRSEIQSACVSLRKREVEELNLADVMEGVDGLYHLPESRYDAGLLGYFKSLIDA